MKKIFFTIFLLNFFTLKANAWCYSLPSNMSTASLSAADKQIISSGNFYIYPTTAWLLNFSVYKDWVPKKAIGFGWMAANSAYTGVGCEQTCVQTYCRWVDYLNTPSGGRDRLAYYNNSEWTLHCLSSTWHTNQIFTGGLAISSLLSTLDTIRSDVSYNSSWTVCISSSSPLESCVDGTKNQNETSIDYGGVCGTCTDGIQQLNVTNPEIYGVDYGWRCSSTIKLTGCTTQALRYIGTNPTVYSIGSYAWYAESVTSSWQAEGNQKHDMLFYNPFNTNQYTWLSFVYWPLSTVNTGALF